MFANNKIHQLDRMLIASIGLLSVLSDGWLSDFLVMLSMVLWLWLPECEKRIKYLYEKKRNQSKKVH